MIILKRFDFGGIRTDFARKDKIPDFIRSDRKLFLYFLFSYAQIITYNIYYNMQY